MGRGKHEKRLVYDICRLTCILLACSFLFIGCDESISGKATIPVVPDDGYIVDINDPNCDDNGPGTESVPWCTIQKALTSLQAGETAYVVPGTYVVDSEITVTQSGTSDNPIRLIGLTTAAAIIGKGNSQSDFENQVFITHPDGIDGRIDGQSTYINFDNADHWEIKGFWFWKVSLMFDYCDDILFADSLAYYAPRVQLGVDLDTGNGVDVIEFRYCTDVVVDNVEVYSIMFDRLYNGLRPGVPPFHGDDREGTQTDTGPQFWWCNNFVVRNSYIYGGKNMYMAYRSTSSDGLWEDNHVFYVSEHIGHFKGSHMTVRRNILGPYRQQGIYATLSCDEQLDDLVVENNIFIDILAMDAYPWPADCTEGYLSPIVMRNNIAINGNTNPPGVSFARGYEIGPYFINLMDSDYDVMWAYQGSHDLLYFWGVIGGPHYYLEDWQTQTDYPQVTQDDHSLVADPMFVTPHEELWKYIDGTQVYQALTNFETSCGWIDEEYGFIDMYVHAYTNCEYPFRMAHTGDFHLQEGSPLIDAGDPAYGTDYPGGRIDIGVYEYDGDYIPPTCEEQGGTCRDDCSLFDSCIYTTGTCMVGECCLGECTEPQTCEEQGGICTSDCGLFDDCTLGNGECTGDNVCCMGTCTEPVVCAGQCLADCTLFDDCSGDSGVCSDDLVCCQGTCTEPPVCEGQCLSDCSLFTDCSSGEGTCQSGSCCVGTCVADIPDGDLSIVGNPNFDPDTLSADERVWYDRTIESMTDSSDYIEGIADSNNLYELGRTLNMYTTSLLRALRATGDLQFLERASELWKIASADLDDSWCDGTQDGEDGYLNWVWAEGQPGDLYYCRDIHAMDESMTHGIVAALADALDQNRAQGEEYGYDFAAEADFWLDYLENHFLAKWYARNGGDQDAAWDTSNGANPPNGGFYKRLAHPRFNQLRIAYHLHQITGDEFYSDKFDEIVAELLAHPSDNPDDTEEPIAYRWKHEVAGADEGWQEMTYARYVTDPMLDLWAEGVFGDDTRMEKYMATFRDHVFTIPPHTTMYGRTYGTEDLVGFNMYTFSGFARWDPTETLAGFAEDNYEMGTGGFYIASGMLFALAERTIMDCEQIGGICTADCTVFDECVQTLGICPGEDVCCLGECVDNGDGPPPNCLPDWQCTVWSACTEGTQTRTCTDANVCGTDEGRPAESQSCTVDPPPAPPPPPPDSGSSPVLFKGSSSPTIFKGSSSPVVFKGGGYYNRCDDGFDNEDEGYASNGCTDGKDYQCGGTESYCWGGVDNDCDGNIDCDDSDCEGDSHCELTGETESGPVYSVGEVLNELFGGEKSPDSETPGRVQGVAEVEAFFGFVNWLVVGVIALLFLGLIFVQHIRFHDHDVPHHKLELLDGFIRNELQHGVSEDKIRTRLKNVGWIEDIVDHEMAKIEKKPKKEIKKPAS
ncbi:MAG: hypothetical protein KKG59_05510 [Nanoarchaeota archaeon]|nr:hypothetical protein [Nanoarchaeota archaeon]